MEPPSQDTVDDLRQKGNHEFQQGHPEHAVTFYTLAMEKAQESNDISARIINLCNRSACYYQLQDYPNARDDAQLAWDISMLSNVKSAYRLAKTFIKLNDYKAAMEILQVPLSPLSQIYTQLDPQEKKSFQELMQLAQQEHAKAPLPIETTIKGVKHRPISIREFIKTKSLGVGNFSEIVICQHRVTHEPFALKILEKKTAADLAKRQHPNVYNEILMEARVLMERLTPHPNIVTMYHAFQDYYNLFYLMDLHNTNQDLWSRIRYQGTHMVGCYPSQAKIWMKQLIGAVEHLHHHGIVHRDLKPENILLNERNHVIVIDFGTAKDLIQTDLNGPEVRTVLYLP
jgi:tetratricopeptide (TPR) repeat protein